MHRPCPGAFHDPATRQDDEAGEVLRPADGLDRQAEERLRSLHETEAAAELGYQAGGLRTAPSIWPGSGRPWRPGLGRLELATEVVHMRTD